jgi:hypothetical protein
MTDPSLNDDDFVAVQRLNEATTNYLEFLVILAHTFRAFRHSQKVAGDAGVARYLRLSDAGVYVRAESIGCTLDQLRTTTRLDALLHGNAKFAQVSDDLRNAWSACTAIAAARWPRIRRPAVASQNGRPQSRRRASTPSNAPPLVGAGTS